MHPQSPRPAPGPLLSDMDGESAAKLESGTAIVKSEFKYDLADLVLQVQADFNDSIAVAGRRVFPETLPSQQISAHDAGSSSNFEQKDYNACRQRVLQGLLYRLVGRTRGSL